MEYRIFNSCGDFPQALRQLLKEAPLFLQYDYLQALEKSEIEGLSFRYVSVSEKNKFIVLYAYQLVSLSNRGLHRIFYRQEYSKLISRFSALLTRYIFGVKPGEPHYLLVNGSVLISGPYYGWAVQGDQSLILQHLNPALKVISEELRKHSKIIATVVKDLAPSLHFKPLSGFSKVMMDPVMELKIRPHWKSFDDYLADLSAKYRLRHTNAQKKMKGVVIRELSKTELQREWETINELYLGVQQRAPIRMIAPDGVYLKSLLAMENPDLSIKAFYLENRMVLFMCGIWRKDHFEAHHIGFDYSLNKKLQLYQNMLFAFIEEAIRRKVKVLSFGRTALEIKSTVGAEPLYFNAWIRFGSTLLNKVILPFLPSSPANNWVQRNPFREEVSPKK